MVMPRNSVPRDARIGTDPCRPLHAGPPLSSSESDLVGFASPEGFDPVLRAFLHQAADLLCDWIGHASERMPLPPVRRQPDIAPSLHGAGMQGLLSDLQLVMEGAYQPSHPGALAHLDPPPLTASIAAELVCAGLNNNLLAEELSPGLTQLEQQLCRWFAARLGLPATAGGVLASGGTLSNLMALVVGREQIDPSSRQQGVVVCSCDAHVSLLKSVRILGLGDQALLQLPVDADGCLCVEALEAALRRLEDEGRPCLAVVATAGTTVRGAIDPLKAVASLCRRYGVWMHVDAAIGGVFALVPSLAGPLEGIAAADSLTLNPQKLLGITKASSLLLLRHGSLLKQAFSTGLPYMDQPSGDHHGGEVGLQGTRPAEVLKLWLGLRQLGERGIESILRNALDRCDRLCRNLDDERLRLYRGSLHLVAFRPLALSGEARTQWSIDTRQRLFEHHFMLSRPLYDRGPCLKAVLGNPHTTVAHLDHLADLINASVI